MRRQMPPQARNLMLIGLVLLLIANIIFILPNDSGSGWQIAVSLLLDLIAVGLFIAAFVIMGRVGKK